MSYNDLTGRRFGRLVVLKLDIEKTKEKRKTYWICQCDCGAIKSIKANHLLEGTSKSCGCLQKELLSNKLSKSNRIEFDSNYGCLRVYFNNCDEYFLCDLEDKDIVENNNCWYKDSYGYVASNIRSGNYNSIIKFHRLVIGKYNKEINDYIVDHINHNKLDNRKFNLRIASYSENSRNKIYKLSNINERHIYYSNKNNKYVFQITIDKKYYRNEFYTLKDALEFRDKFYKEHPDEFRYDYSTDYRNRDNNIIHPFIFIDIDK